MDSMTTDPHRVYRLSNVIQEYDWGSPTAIPELLGRANPEGRPEAELWMGAHPKAPSRLIEVRGAGEAGNGADLSGPGRPRDGSSDEAPTLAGLIAAAPIETLGRPVAERYGSRLPFLFKVLAAAKGLSIQAHPNLEQARDGFARENAAGIPLSAPERNYRDPNHKPEILCALGPFWGMCGFRPTAAIHEELARFGLASLQWAAPLREAKDERQESAALVGFLEGLLALKGQERSAILERTLGACRRLRDEGPRYEWVARLGDQFPGDIGILAPLYLNLVLLEAGEALYLPAGELHAYLEGTGVELMANSDNVLRGGLTGKHVDRKELMSVLAFHTAGPRLIRPTRANDTLELYHSPTSEFRLGRIQLSNGADFRAPLHRSVELLVCVEGRGELSYSHPKQWIRFSRGDSFVVPAAVPGYRLTGDALLYRADVPVAEAEST